MNFFITAFLLLMWSSCEAIPHCENGCEYTNHYEKQYIQPISELRTSSVAPWTLENRLIPGEMGSFQEAKCTKCTIPNMIPKLIHIQVVVFKRAHNDTHPWCRCKRKLPVACTCVVKPSVSH